MVDPDCLMITPQQIADIWSQKYYLNLTADERQDALDKVKKDTEHFQYPLARQLKKAFQDAVITGTGVVKVPKVKKDTEQFQSPIARQMNSSEGNAIGNGTTFNLDYTLALPPGTVSKIYTDQIDIVPSDTTHVLGHTCSCGIDSIGGGKHSDWCGKHEK